MLPCLAVDVASIRIRCGEGRQAAIYDVLVKDIGLILLGAALALIGGLVTSRYQLRQTERMTVRLRAAEDQARALVSLADPLGALERRLDEYHDFRRQYPDAPRHQWWADVDSALLRLDKRWTDEVSVRIFDEQFLGSIESVLSARQRAWDAIQNDRGSLDEIAPFLLRHVQQARTRCRVLLGGTDK